MKKRRKTNIKQVIAAIRLDLLSRFDEPVPTEEITITWKGGDKRVIYLHVLTGQVTGSVKEQFYTVGQI